MGRTRYQYEEPFKMPADKGMALVNKMIHPKYTASVCGKADTWASIGVSHSIKHGKPYHWSKADVDILNRGIKQMAADLEGVKVSARCISESDNKFMYGTGVAEQIMKARHIFVLPYIFTTRLGHTEQWRLNRISLKASPVYDHFERDDIRGINRVLGEIISVLKYIELIPSN